jgi:hypothetical protein
MDKRLHQRAEVMNPPVSAARGTEAGNLNTARCHGLGASPRGAEARPVEASPPPSDWNEWDVYEEDGPLDLEDQLENALRRADSANGGK